MKFNIIIMGLLYSTSLFCSQPPPQEKKFTYIIYPHTIIELMNKHNLSPMKVCNIVKNGQKYKSNQEEKCLFVCPDSKIGVVADSNSSMVTNIIVNKNDQWLNDFLVQQDAAAKKKRIGIK